MRFVLYFCLPFPPIEPIGLNLQKSNHSTIMVPRLLSATFLLLSFLPFLAAQGFEKTTGLSLVERVLSVPGGGALVIGSVLNTNGFERVAAARYDSKGDLLWLSQQEDWQPTQHVSAFAASPDGTGGWWIQGNTVLQPSDNGLLCNWHLNADGTTAAFFSSAQGDVRDVTVLNDTLWMAYNYAYYFDAKRATLNFGYIPSVFGVVATGGAASNGYHTAERFFPDGTGHLVMMGGVISWNYHPMSGYYITGVSPYFRRLHPQNNTSESRSYTNAGNRIVDFAQMPSGGGIAISQKVWGASITVPDSSWAFQIAANLDLIWRKGFRNRLFQQITAAADGSGTVVCGVLKMGNGTRAFLSKFDPAGNLLWERDFGEASSTAITADPDGGFWLAVTPTTSDARARLYKTDANGWTKTNGLLGILFQDNDGDCAFSAATDEPLAGFGLALASADGDTLRAFSLADGSFGFPADTGTHQLFIFPDNLNYVRCQTAITHTFLSTYDTLTLALGFRDTCPDLTLKPVTDIACGPGNARAAFRVAGGGSDYDFLWGNGSADSLLTHLSAGFYSVTVSEGGCETYGQLEVRFDFRAKPLGEHHYGSDDSEPVWDQVIPSPDGQFFYTVGRILYKGADVDTIFGVQDIWLVKTDRKGQKVWAKTFGGSQIESSAGIAVMPDGTIAVAGNTESHDGIFQDTLLGRQAFVLKISPDGVLLSVVKAPPVYQNQSAEKIVANPNGAVVIGGVTSIPLANGGTKYHLWLAKLNADGAWAWSREYFDTYWARSNALLYDAVNGGYLYNFENSTQPVHLLKVNEQGEIVWQDSNAFLADCDAWVQRPDGSFLAGNHNRQIGLVTSLGALDNILTLPAQVSKYVESITSTSEGGWAILSNNSDYPSNAFTDLVLLDAQLQPTNAMPLSMGENKFFSFAQEIRKDTFFVAGLGDYKDTKREEWLLGNVWKLPLQPSLLPPSDTTVCHGSIIPLGLDSLSTMYPTLTWQLGGLSLPSGGVLVGGQDTVLRIFGQNEEGCYALAERKVFTDKLKAAIEVQGSACGLPNGRIYLNISNPIGPLQFAWDDSGTSEIIRQNLALGIYPLSVSDSLCNLHYAPEVQMSDAPLPVDLEQKGYVGRWTPGYYQAGKIIALTDGTPVYWNNGIIKVNYGSNLVWANQGNGALSINKLVAFPDNTFALAFYASSETPNLLHFDHLGQQIGAYKLPVKSVSDIVALPEGGYVAAGHLATENYPYDSDPVLMKLDAAFQPVWTKQFADPAHSETTARVALLPNGNIALATGWPNTGNLSDLKLRFFDLEGNLLFERKYGGEKEEQWIDLKTTPDGDLLTVAKTYSLGGDLAGLNISNYSYPKTWLFRIDGNNGEIKWSRLVPGSSPFSDLPGFFPDGTSVFPSHLESYPNDENLVLGEHLTAFDPATGDSLWTVQAGDHSLAYGTPYCVPNGDILWPHVWYNNYDPGPSGHCCPSADFYLQLNIFHNGQIPQPFSLGPDTTLCAGDTLHVSAAAASIPVTWENNTYNPERDLSAAGIYIARAGSVCPFSDTLRLDYCLYLPLPDSLTGCAPVLIDGGMPGLLHTWSDGQNGQQASVTTPGWLSLSVINLAGQSIVDSVFVHVYPISTYEVFETDPICFEGQNGQASVSPTGDGQPYAYLWDTGATDSLLQNLAAGAYSLTVTDIFGCTFSAEVALMQPAYWGLNAYFSQNSDSTYALSAYLVGTIHHPLSYLWSNGATTQSTTAMSGLVSVSITDALGCTRSDTLELPLLSSVSPLLTGEVLQVFPNPFSEVFFVKNIAQKPTFAELRDMAGRSLTLAFDWLPGQNALRFSGKGWPRGVYALLLRWGERSELCKLVKVE